MKAAILASLIGTCAVDAFAPGRELLENTLDHNPTRLGSMGNSVVSENDLIQAAAAADGVYHSTCGKYRSWDANSWECIGVEEKPHNFWFSGTDAFDRFHFFKAPGNKCGIVFRGTKHSDQWLTNLNSWSSQPWYTEEAHSGFVDAFNGNPKGSGLIGAMSWWIWTREASAEQCKNGVYFVGHSLGGAFATLADIFYEHKEKEKGTNKKAISITFGAPAMVKYRSPFTPPGPVVVNELRVFHEYDWVTRDYGGSFQHRGVGKEMKCPASCDCKTVEAYDVSAFKSGVMNACRLQKAANEYHKMYFYKKWANAPATPTPAPSKQPTPAPTPGKGIGSACWGNWECNSGYCQSVFFAIGYCYYRD